MVSKLSFKGDKTKKKKPKRSVPSRPQPKPSQSPEPVYINGESVNLSDISIDNLTSGWTHLYPRDLTLATPSMLDTEKGRVPIIITFHDEDRHLILNVVQQDNAEESGKTSKKVIFDNDYELADVEKTIIFTEEKIDLQDVRHRIEPRQVSQVFILSEVTSMFQTGTKFIEGVSTKKRVYSLKTSDGEYLVMDPESHTVKLSLSLTSNGICTLLPESDKEGIPQYRIIFGAIEDANTLLATPSGSVRVIPDPDDVLGTASRAVLRLRCADASPAQRLVRI